MILNEDYFKDIEITDEDIESSDDIVISHNNEYATSEEWFTNIKSRYTYCIEIPLKRDISWKLNPKPIIKRLFYVFDAYEIEYSEPTLQEHIYLEDNLENGYSKCNFIDYNGFNLISNYYKTPEIEDRTKNNISVVVFFNLPEVHSYKEACTFIGNIINCCLLNNKIKDLTYGYFIVWNFVIVPCKRYIFRKYRNYKIAAAYIEAAITMFFPEKSSTIRQELSADNNALLNKLLRFKMMYGSL